MSAVCAPQQPLPRRKSVLNSVRTLWERHGRCGNVIHAVRTLWKRHGRCKDAMETSCGRRRDAVVHMGTSWTL